MKRYAIALIAIIQSIAVAQEPQGEWEDWFWFGNTQLDATVAINLIHVWNGSTTKVLALTRPVPNFPTIPTSRLWTPAPASLPGNPGVFEEADVAADTFCGGHSALADGRILHVGGRFVNDVDLFNPWEPVPNQWNIPLDPSDMTFNRWYPTATTLADGRVLPIGGHRGTYDRISGAVARPEVLWYITGAGSGLVTAPQAGCGQEGART